MPAPSSLTDYLDSLPDSRRASFDRLVPAVAAIPVAASNASLVFRAGQTDHPVYDDAEFVFWRAVQQLQLREAVSDGELPLVYWGFHSIDLLGRRNANGILVTDRTVYLVDVGSTSARFPTGAVDPDSIRVSDDRLELAGSGVGLAQIAKLLEPTSAEDAATYLRSVIVAVQAVADAGSGQGGDGGSASVDESETVERLVLASRLSSDFLLPSRPKDAKGLAKLSSKWKLPAEETLLVSLSSATFVGVYGIAITDAAVYSRDLMEPLHRTALDDVTGFAWDAEAKTFQVAAGHAAPTHPAITDENRAYVVSLLERMVGVAHRG